MYSTPKFHSSYLHTVLDSANLKRIVERIVRFLKKSPVEFDSIAFTGVSGALVAPTVAMRLGKGIIAVRKKDQSTHSSWGVEGPVGGSRYIILDDLIDTGATIRFIVKSIDDELQAVTSNGVYTCVGVVEYNDLAKGRKAFRGTIKVTAGGDSYRSLQGQPVTYEVPILTTNVKRMRSIYVSRFSRFSHT